MATQDLADHADRLTELLQAWAPDDSQLKEGTGWIRDVFGDHGLIAKANSVFAAVGLGLAVYDMIAGRKDPVLDALEKLSEAVGVMHRDMLDQFSRLTLAIKLDSAKEQASEAIDAIVGLHDLVQRLLEHPDLELPRSDALKFDTSRVTVDLIKLEGVATGERLHENLLKETYELNGGEPEPVRRTAHVLSSWAVLAASGLTWVRTLQLQDEFPDMQPAELETNVRAYAEDLRARVTRIRKACEEWVSRTYWHGPANASKRLEEAFRHCSEDDNSGAATLLLRSVSHSWRHLDFGVLVFEGYRARSRDWCFAVGGEEFKHWTAERTGFGFDVVMFHAPKKRKRVGASLSTVVEPVTPSPKPAGRKKGQIMRWLGENLFAQSAVGRFDGRAELGPDPDVVARPANPFARQPARSKQPSWSWTPREIVSRLSGEPDVTVVAIKDWRKEFFVQTHEDRAKWVRSGLKSDTRGWGIVLWS